MMFPCKEEFHRVNTERRLEIFVFESSGYQFGFHTQCLSKFCDWKQLHIARAIAEERFLKFDQSLGDLDQCFSTELDFMLEIFCIGNLFFQIAAFLTVYTAEHVEIIFIDFNLRKCKIAECNIVFIDKLDHHHIRLDVWGTAVALILGTRFWVEQTNAEHSLLDFLLGAFKAFAHLMDVRTAGQVNFIQKLACNGVLLIQLKQQTFF